MSKLRSQITAAAGLLLAVCCRTGEADQWPQFRGAAVDGVAQSQCPDTWDDSNNVRWKFATSGEGWSSPVIWGDQLFLTEAVPIGLADEASRPEPYSGGGGRRRDDLTTTTYRWDVICLQASTGKLLWRQAARTGRPTMPRHSSNTYATETPITDGQRVYAYFGMTGIYCYDMDGELQWQKDLGSFEMRAGWGTSSSPILFDEKLFLQVDNEQQSFIVALDAATGEEVWRVDHAESSQYSTPIIWRNRLRNELIAGGTVCRSFDPQTGELLWQLDMEKGRSSATPLAVGDRLYVGTEFRNRGGADDGGGYLFAVTPGGSGEITPPDDGASGEFVAWKLERSGIEMASPVMCAGHLYLFERRSGTLHCIDSETGQVAYRTRLPGGRAFWASPWAVGDNVFGVDTGGTTYVIAAGPEFSLIGRNVIDEQTWSTPAIANGALYLRTIDHLYCIAAP